MQLIKAKFCQNCSLQYTVCGLRRAYHAASHTTLSALRVTRRANGLTAKLWLRYGPHCTCCVTGCGILRRKTISALGVVFGIKSLHYMIAAILCLWILIGVFWMVLEHEWQDSHSDSSLQHVTRQCIQRSLSGRSELAKQAVAEHGGMKKIAFGSSFAQSQYWNRLCDLNECPHAPCIYERNLTLADIVLFHNISDITELLARAGQRSSKQIWALVSTRPTIGEEYTTAEIRKWSKLTGIREHSWRVRNALELAEQFDISFNWSLSYRRESEVFFPIFGAVQELASSREDPHEDTAQRNYHGKKRHFAMIIMTRCQTEGDTQKHADGSSHKIRNNASQPMAKGYSKAWHLVLLMQSLVEVHVYSTVPGGCTAHYRNRFYRSSANPRDEIRNYKFYLSFEDWQCRDYITDKFFINGLQAGAIPVVLGGSSKKEYLRVAPVDSFIYVDDFLTVGHLTRYMLQVDMYGDWYNRFHRWRRRYRVIVPSLSCFICQKLFQTAGSGPKTIEKKAHEQREKCIL